MAHPKIETEGAIEALKPKSAPYKRSAGGGLSILVQPNGSKLWRLNYRVQRDGRTFFQTKALGAHPAVKLADARFEREAIKKLLRDGKDPAKDARPVRPGEGPTFEEAAKDWHKAESHAWGAGYQVTVWRRFKLDILPEIGAVPVSSLTEDDIEKMLRKVEARGAIVTARRLRPYVAAVLERAKRKDLAPEVRRIKIAKAPDVKHQKALFKEADIGQFLVDLRAYWGEPETKEAALLAILTAARTKEIIGARWSELENLDDADEALWRIPAERMKKKREFLVPLSTQAVAVIQRIKAFGHKSEYLFPAEPGRRGVHMSNNAMLFACYAMGYRSKMTMHGWRRTFSTKAHGRLDLWESEWIEKALSHDDDDAIRSSYNAAEYLDERRRLLQWWADYLERLGENAKFGVATLRNERRFIA